MNSACFASVRKGCDLPALFRTTAWSRRARWGDASRCCLGSPLNCFGVRYRRLELGRSSLGWQRQLSMITRASARLQSHSIAQKLVAERAVQAPGGGILPRLAGVNARAGSLPPPRPRKAIEERRARNGARPGSPRPLNLAWTASTQTAALAGGRLGGSRVTGALQAVQGPARKSSISFSVCCWWRGYQGRLCGMSGISSKVAGTRSLTPL